MGREKWIRLCDQGMEGVLGVLLFVLPINKMTLVKGTGITLLALLWATKAVLSRKWIFRPTPAGLPILLFFAWSVITIFTAVDPFYSFKEVKNEILTQIFFFFLIVSNFEWGRIKRLLNYLFASAFILSLIGIAEFFYKEGAMFAPIVRVGSLTSDYIYFSTYLALTVPAILAAFMASSGSRIRKWSFIVLFLCALTALYFTFTRAAWLAVFVQFFIYFFVVNRRVFYVLFGLFIFAGAIIFISLPHYPALKQTVSALSRTHDIPRRIEQWSFDVKAVREHPWVGIGYGRESLKKAYPSHNLVDNEWWHAFNIFLGMAMGVGLPGFLLFLWIISILVREIWRRYSTQSSELKYFSAAVFSILFGYMLRNWFDQVYNDAPALLFWILIAMTIAGEGKEERESHLAPETLEQPREPLALSLESQ